MEISRGLLIQMGFDLDGNYARLNTDPVSGSKYIGKCQWCRLSRVAFVNLKYANVWGARCPETFEPEAFQCSWGGRGNLPLGEE